MGAPRRAIGAGLLVMALATACTGGPAESPSGTANPVTPSAQSPGGTARSPGGTAQSPGGTAQSPGGTARSPGGTAQSPGGADQSPDTPGQPTDPPAGGSANGSPTPPGTKPNPNPLAGLSPDDIDLARLSADGVGLLVGYRNRRLRAFATTDAGRSFANVTPQFARTDLVATDAAVTAGAGYWISMISVISLNTVVIRSDNLGDFWFGTGALPPVGVAPESSVTMSFDDSDGAWLTLIRGADGLQVVIPRDRRSRGWSLRRLTLPLATPVVVSPEGDTLFQVQAGQARVYLSTDGGETWRSEASPVADAETADGLQFAGRRPIVASRETAVRGARLVVSRRTDSGWVSTRLDSTSSGSDALSLSTPSRRSWWLLDGAVLSRTRDAGRSWSRRTITLPNGVSARQVMALGPRSAWLRAEDTRGTGFLFATRDAGASWARLDPWDRSGAQAQRS